MHPGVLMQLAARRGGIAAVQPGPHAFRDHQHADNAQKRDVEQRDDHIDMAKISQPSSAK